MAFHTVEHSHLYRLKSTRRANMQNVKSWFQKIPPQLPVQNAFL